MGTRLTLNLLSPYAGYVFAIVLTVLVISIGLWRGGKLWRAALLSLLLIALSCLLVKLAGKWMLQVYDNSESGYYLYGSIWYGVYKDGEEVLDKSLWPELFEEFRPSVYAKYINNRLCVRFAGSWRGYLLISLAVSGLFYLAATVAKDGGRTYGSRVPAFSAAALFVLLALCFIDRSFCITLRFTKPEGLGQVVAAMTGGTANREVLDNGVMLYHKKAGSYSYASSRLSSSHDSLYDSIRYRTEDPIPMYSQPSKRAEISGWLDSLGALQMDWCETTDKRGWMYYQGSYIRISDMISAFTKKQESPYMPMLFRNMLFLNDSLAYESSGYGWYVSADMMRKYLPLEYWLLIPAILLLTALYLARRKKYGK